MQKINGRIPKGKEKGFSPFFNKKKLLQINNINCFWKSAMISQFHFKEIKKKINQPCYAGFYWKRKRKEKQFYF